MANPVFSEGLRAAFTDSKGCRYLIGYLIACCAAVAFIWPFRDLAHFIRFGRAPSSFIAMGILTVIANSLLAVQFSIQQTGSSYSIREWFRMTPVTPGPLLAGKVAASVVHSAVLTAITVPFLTVASAPSGYGMVSIFSISMLTFTVSILIRCIGIALISIVEHRTFLIHLFIWISIAILFLFTLRILPLWNPLLQVSEMATAFSMGTVIRYSSLSIAAVFTGYIMLRRRHRRISRSTS